MVENYLFIPDTQDPFSHPDALPFCRYLKRHYKISDENIIHAGDEEDQYHGSLYKKNPDALHTPTSELKEVRERFKAWYSEFPKMKLCESNHGGRWLKKALDADIPSELLRKHRDVLEAPEGWVWQKRWIIEGSKRRFMAEHGDDWGGQQPHVQAAMHNGISTIMGHHHSLADIRFLVTAMQQMWACVSGSLIDFDQYAFEYAKKNKLKPVSGATVILNGGAIPMFHPLF